MLRTRKKKELKKPRPLREMQLEHEDGVITGYFDHDYQAIKEIFADSSDFHARLIRTQDGKRVALFYYNDLINPQILGRDIISPIQGHEGPLTIEILTGQLVSAGHSNTERSLTDIGPTLAWGGVILLVDGLNEAVLVIIQQLSDRGIERSQSEDVLIGPHHSFSEDLGKNLALLRRYLSSPRLKIKTLMLGRISKTHVSIIYIEGVAQEKLVLEAQERLNRIDIDIVHGMSYLTDFIEDEPLALFPQLKFTERPDRVIAALGEGRIALLAEGDPTCLIAPLFLPEALQASEDYTERPLVAAFFRWLRLLSAALGMFLPGAWIALVSFHHAIIPPALFSSIVAGREAVPFPTIIEAFLLLLAFDIVIEASTRLPSAVGQAIGIVGAIILGQSAVQASLISPTMTIVVALSGLAVYTLPSPNAVSAIRLLKYFVLFASSIFGLFGTIWTFILLTVKAASMRSFGYPLLFPVAPLNTRGWLDIFFKLPNTMLKRRPHFLAAENEVRLNQKKTEEEAQRARTKDTDS